MILYTGPLDDKKSPNLGNISLKKYFLKARVNPRLMRTINGNNCVQYSIKPSKFTILSVL